MLNTIRICQGAKRQASLRAGDSGSHMNFDPRVAEISSTRYGEIKLYTNSIFQAYLEHLDKLLNKYYPYPEEKNTPQPLFSEKRSKSALGSVGIPKEKKRGRPKGSKNKIKQEASKSTPTHIVTPEPFETTEEFRKRKAEESQ